MSILKNSLYLSLGLFLGRIIGYVRELLIANNHGISKSSDLVILALTVPEFVSNILVTGLATNIIVPRLHRFHPRNTSQFLQDSWLKILILSVAGFCLFSAFSIYYFPISTALILIVSCLSIFPNSMTALTSAYLTFREKFRAQAFSNLVFNLVATLGIFLFDDIYLITIGFLLASVCRFLLCLRDAADTSFKPSIWSVKKAESIKENDLTVSIFLLSALSSGLIVLNPLIARFVAASFSDGSVSIISYSEKLYLLPLTLVISPYLSASYAKLSGILSTRTANIIAVIKKPMLLISSISIGISVFCWILAPFIVSLTFGLSGISTIGQSQISDTFRAFLPGLIFSSCSLYMNNVFFSLKREKLVAITSVASVLINALGYLMASNLLREAWSLAAVNSATSFIVFCWQSLVLIQLNRKMSNG